jgi:ABC-type multidrug transport system fused ATPase/permease subunit
VRVFKTHRRLLALLDVRERRQFALLFVMILAMGLLDMVGVASILPFLAVLSNRDIVQDNSVLAFVYDTLGFASTDGFLVFLGVVTLAFVVLGQGFKALTLYAVNRFSKMREYTIGARLLAGYLHQPYAWFLNRHSADLGKTVLSEVGGVVGGALVPAARGLAQGAVVISLVALLVVVNPFAAAVTALVVAGSYGLVFTVSRRYLSHIGRERLRANEERFRVAQEAMGGIKDVKLLGLEPSYLARFDAPASRFARYHAAAQAIAETPRFILEAIVFGTMMVLLLVLLARAEGRLEAVLPVIGVYAFAGARLFPALQQLYASITQMRFAGAALDALHTDLMTTSVPKEVASPPAPLRLRERLVLRDVRYAYPGAERPAIAGLDLAIGANTTVGLVGATGAGKTTAVDVVLGLLEPDGGTLEVDGVGVDAGNRRAWQRTLGYVPQQIFLTDDSVAANIALGVPRAEIDMAAVERAARIAELHDFVVRELPQGYATAIGERGVRLSGGQRQRIGIARALYHDPDVLILDEATSALDNRTERAVMDAVHNLGHAKTIVMIAHRLSTVRDCDAIFMLEQGRCVAAGTYDELLDRSRSFRELAQAS